ncbi:hypothetical protein XCR_1684 [Xanthomonas campestris pv. raphani 756C]|nr:hypothetical protein XCR_1684 [Xanthomonas campestris pv. raphani 756C]
MRTAEASAAGRDRRVTKGMAARQTRAWRDIEVGHFLAVGGAALGLRFPLRTCR